MLQILSLAIGLSFVYLLVSLVVTAFNELALSFFDMRATFLKEGLTELLGNHQPTVEAFLEHGLIDAFSRKSGGNPAYIPPNAFVAVMLDLVARAKPDALDPTKVRQAVDIAGVLAATGSGSLAQINPKLSQSLNALFDEAGGDLVLFRAGLERWFVQSTDRISGWYKRYVQQWLFVFALVITIAGNVDSIRIIQGFTANPKLLDSVVQAADESAKRQAPTTTQNIGALTAQLQDSVTQLNSLSLPIGWGDAQFNYLFRDLDPGVPAAPVKVPGWNAAPVKVPRWNWSHLLSATAGWLLTALAVSLGAPFWFQMLQKFITIRGSGRSPAEAEKAAVAAVASAAQAIAPAIAARTPVVDASRQTLVVAPEGH